VKTILAILRGAERDPLVVGAARALLLAAIHLAITAAIYYLSGPGAAVAAAPALLLVLRAAEGAVDKKLAAPEPLAAPPVVVPPAQVPPPAP
jgi:hypothetical protein